MAWNILIVDRDRGTCQQLYEQLLAMGHSVVVETTKQGGEDKLKNQDFQLVMINPAPLADARSFVLPLRWHPNPYYQYVFLLDYDGKSPDLHRSGLNDHILKPIDNKQLPEKMANATRLLLLDKMLREPTTIQTEGVIFDKRACHILVQSALDRTYRYGEQAYVIFIGVKNYADILAQAGVEATESFMQDLMAHFAKLRRLSDFLGRVTTEGFMLLMQRPALDNEPFDAADRYLTALTDFVADHKLGALVPQMNVTLIGLPTGQVMFDRST
jgi:CheY-like chemotaxis protein